MILPTGFTAVEWADRVLALTADNVTGRLDNPDKWREWAAGFLRNSRSIDLLPPDPEGFSDWREWAERMYPVIQQLAS